ncbi:hypothetical protein SPRG_12424 [Saprolegnia parasitica CBS 223.65]|uniref:N-acetyltransferase domain-containing protein n=1 Tax=Saprolegnia parasitica (strain CBS 223.65) TaxID=695850 RepID=A0A067C3M4_SAPPC|nr:hypothetical protein SPRG_12424 [Saprolegnia parasitica CBS 223.65]KDO21417.1 hypothetical protein SPRG_12424 [Saprolegnia parasitica CBS 223.65]|eukprot:XP_012207864.1 hypothetical protein SPRG_12424 [Saprolegnia parasitica CBS 223.65]
MVSYREAATGDAAAIAALVNYCYRGEPSKEGWTTEADFLTKPRTDAEEVASLMTATSKIILAEEDAVLVGCVNVQLKVKECTGYLGLFVVLPSLQGRGLGKALLATAEATFTATWPVAEIEITVFTIRTELLAFYERRGYKRTGRTWSANIPGATVPNLMFETLVKQVQQSPQSSCLS